MRPSLAYLVTVCISLFVYCAADNQYVTTVNPGCPTDLCTNGTQLVYGRLQRDNDSLHVLIGAGQGLGDLTVSYVQSGDPRQMVAIDWDRLLSDSPADRAMALNFTNPRASVLAKFTLLISSLIEYSDTSDSVSPSSLTQNATYFTFHPTGSFLWQVSMQPKLDSNGVTTIGLMANRTNGGDANHTRGSYYPDQDPTLPLESPALPPPPTPSPLFANLSGFVGLTVRLSPQGGLRAAELPHLQFTGQNTQLELLMKNLTGTLPNARFAVEAALLDLGSPVRQQTVLEPKNIDDEYTPGIFRTTNWCSTDPVFYVQWKPVAYKADTRSIGYSTDAKYTGLVLGANVTSRLAASVDASLAFVLNGGGGILAAGRATALNVTFGQNKDMFYAGSNHMLWALSVGLGEPPSDSVSTLVIIVILCGLGIPALLMAVALVYLLVRQIRGGGGGGDGSVSAYEPINA